MRHLSRAPAAGAVLAAFAGVAALLLMPGEPLAAITQPGVIQGHVFDTSHAAWPGATVAVLKVNTGDLHVIKTGEDGSYVLRELAEGQYEVSVEMPGTWPERRLVWLSDTSPSLLDFTLEAAETHGVGEVVDPGLKPGEPHRGTICGKVTDVKGRALGKVTIIVADPHTGKVYNTQTSKAGGYLLRVAEGQYGIAATRDGLAPEYRSAKVDLTLDAKVDLEMHPKREGRGSVPAEAKTVDLSQRPGNVCGKAVDSLNAK